VDPTNVRSIGAVTRLGAVAEGVLRGHRTTADGHAADSVSFSVLAPEWPDVRSRLLARLEHADHGTARHVMQNTCTQPIGVLA
jgi:N-acetyltransferase